MKVIYHCFGGSHASPVAAAIHLQSFSNLDLPTSQDLLALNLFDTVPPTFHGTLVFLGEDSNGNEIFVLGTRNDDDILLKVLKGITRIIGEDYQEYMFVDVKPCINFPMRIGGFLSRSVRLVSVGRPLVTWGVIRAFPKIAELVKTTRSRLTRLEERKNGNGA